MATEVWIVQGKNKVRLTTKRGIDITDEVNNSLRSTLTKGEELVGKILLANPDGSNLPLIDTLADIKALLQTIVDDKPVDIYSQIGVSETADTDITSDISHDGESCTYRIFVTLETAGVFSVMLKNTGTTKTLKLNEGTALVANCAYIFDILVLKGDLLNFQTSVTGNVTLRVQQIEGGAEI